MWSILQSLSEVSRNPPTDSRYSFRGGIGVQSSEMSVGE